MTTPSTGNIGITTVIFNLKIRLQVAMSFKNKDRRGPDFRPFDRTRRVWNTRRIDFSNFCQIMLVIGQEDQANWIVSLVRL